MIVNRIYSYFVDIGWTAQAAVAELWKERWRLEGWEPAILGQADAMKDPRWEAMKQKIESFPCVHGSRGFEAVNFERWLAFSQVEEPAVVADFDVFPIRRFPPRDFGALPVSGDGAGGPGFIAGRREDFSKIVDTILAYVPEPDDEWQGQPHLCDMRVLRKRQPTLYRIAVLCITYGFPNFGTVPLAHYSNGSLDAMTNFHKEKSKSEAIKELLATHYQS
jgi:hypothetical protein